MSLNYRYVCWNQHITWSLCLIWKICLLTEISLNYTHSMWLLAYLPLFLHIIWYLLLTTHFSFLFLLSSVPFISCFFTWLNFSPNSLPILVWKWCLLCTCVDAYIHTYIYVRIYTCVYRHLNACVCVYKILEKSTFTLKVIVM